MAYEPYASAEDYAALFPNETIAEAALVAASRHVDSLTYNRIRIDGFANLTEFQQEVVKEVVCRQAKFETDYADVIGSVLASYSINGVSVKAGHGEGVRYYGGLAVPGEVSSLLRQTGLCDRLARAAT